MNTDNTLIIRYVNSLFNNYQDDILGQKKKKKKKKKEVVYTKIGHFFEQAEDFFHSFNRQTCMNNLPFQIDLFCSFLRVKGNQIVSQRHESIISDQPVNLSRINQIVRKSYIRIEPIINQSCQKRIVFSLAAGSFDIFRDKIAF